MEAVQGIERQVIGVGAGLFPARREALHQSSHCVLACREERRCGCVGVAGAPGQPGIILGFSLN